MEHNTKCDNSPPAHLPDRVIKIDPDAAVMPKIVENVEEDSDYIALSHCWGNRKGPLRTLLANLQDHKNAIALDQDSNTLRDAIQITRALHISYLWIDSLCIIQEDPADWVVQSAKMATIYANARLTISAASAPEAEGGILAERSEPYRLDRPLASGESITVCVREQPSHDVFKGQFNEESNLNGWMLNEEMQEPSYEGLPLFTRAWACQERLLSPRILHFTPSEMIFECGSGFHCECNRISDKTYDRRKLTSLRTDYLATVASIKNASDIQDQLETTSVVDDQSTTSVEYRPHIRKKDTVLRWVWNSLLKTSLKRILNPITFIELDAFIQELLQISYPIDEGSVNASMYKTDAERVWLRIITEITTKALTYEQDRLPAISGLARQLEPKLGKYYAGHWKDHIQGLLWYPADSTGHRPRGTHMPPTWSWASVEGSCIYTEGTMVSILFIVSQVEVNLLSSDPFGMVKGGTIQVSGRIADTTVESHEDDVYFLNGSGRIFEFLPDVRGTPGEEKIETGQRLQCFLCGYTWLAYFVGWVLKKTPSKRKTYQRLGRFMTPVPGSGVEGSSDRTSMFKARTINII